MRLCGDAGSSGSMLLADTPKRKSEMKTSIFLWTGLCICLNFVHSKGENISAVEASLGDLCRFKGICLDCSQGGCEDMCKFYDNNCCDKSSLTNEVLQEWQYSCVRQFPDMYDLHLDCRGSFNGVYGVYMVTKCAESWMDDSVRSGCENDTEDDILSKIPVFDISNKIVTYKNMYCAFCNMANLHSIQFWKFDLMCKEETKMDETIEFDTAYCFIRLVHQQHRMCAMNLIDSCDENGNFNTSLKEKCEHGLPQYVYVWKMERLFNVYKNEFCAECNSEAGSLQCWAFQAFTCWPQSLPPYSSVQAEISLNLYSTRNSDSADLFNSVCGEGVLYDPFHKLCLNITCLTSQNICVSGKCHLAELSSSEFEISNDSSLYVVSLDDFVPKSRYFADKSKAKVCLDDQQYVDFLMLRADSSTGVHSPGGQVTLEVTPWISSKGIAPNDKNLDLKTLCLSAILVIFSLETL